MAGHVACLLLQSRLKARPMIDPEVLEVAQRTNRYLYSVLGPALSGALVGAAMAGWMGAVLLLVHLQQWLGITLFLLLSAVVAWLRVFYSQRAKHRAGNKRLY